MKKLGWILLAPMLILGALVLWSAPAAADTVTLNGVANASWSSNLQTYLYVVNKSTGDYFYQWNYGESSPPWASWASVSVLGTDLADGILVVNGNPIPVTNWQVQSGGDAFNSLTDNVIWETRHLAAGTYILKLTPDSDAYNLHDYKWGNETDNPNTWNAYVQIFAKYDHSAATASFQFGDYNKNTTISKDFVLADYRATVDGYEMVLTDSAVVHFYLNDDNSVDNAGSVSLEFNHVPLPGSLYLLGSGLVFLLARRVRLRA